MKQSSLTMLYDIRIPGFQQIVDEARRLVCAVDAGAEQAGSRQELLNHGRPLAIMELCVRYRQSVHMLLDIGPQDGRFAEFGPRDVGKGHPSVVNLGQSAIPGFAEDCI